MGTGRRPTLSTKGADTSTWGKRLSIKNGLNDSLVGAPFGPFTPSPDTNQLLRLVDVRAPTAKPSTTSRDVTAYVFATQVYDNNKSITTALPQRQNPQAVTPVANRAPAFEALFGRMTTSRGGVSTFEEFVIPAHGVALHIGSDTARVEVFFDPAKANIVDDAIPDSEIRGKLAAGFEVVGGVATAGFYPDEIRQFYDTGIAGLQRFVVPQFAKTLQVFTDAPQAFSIFWQAPENLGAIGPLSNVPTTLIPYVDAPMPIPVNAGRLQISTAVAVNESPILVWGRKT